MAKCPDIVDAIWRLELPASKRLVLLAMADYANGTDQSGASVPLIAWKTGYSDRQVQRIIAALVKDKILTSIGKTAKRSFIYRMDFEQGEQKPSWAEYQAARCLIAEPRQDVTDEHDKMSPPERQDVTTDGDKNDILSPKKNSLLDFPSDSLASSEREEESAPPQKQLVARITEHRYWQAFVRGWDGTPLMLNARHVDAVSDALEALERMDVDARHVEGCTRERIAAKLQEGDKYPYLFQFLPEDMPPFLLRQRHAARQAERQAASILPAPVQHSADDLADMRRSREAFHRQFAGGVA